MRRFSGRLDECSCHTCRVFRLVCLHSTEMSMVSHWRHEWGRLASQYTIISNGNFAHLSVWLSVCLSVCMSVCMSLCVHLSVCNWNTKLANLIVFSHSFTSFWAICLVNLWSFYGVLLEYDVLMCQCTLVPVEWPSRPYRRQTWLESPQWIRW